METVRTRSGKVIPPFILERMTNLWDFNLSLNILGRNDEELLYSNKAITTKNGFPDKLCEDIFILHALADTACQAFGIPCSPNEDNNLIICWANLMLAQTGSCSRLPKRHGLVLPKMRTPQGGITLRSFSHHVTFHESEANINWRTITLA